MAVGKSIPELVLPAGDLEKLGMALAYGADAVYVGAAGFSMRPDAASFTVEQLADAVAQVRAAGKKLYVGINCLMFDEDLEKLQTWLTATSDLELDAVIIGDLGTLRCVRDRRPDLPVHISTQLSTANIAAARFLRDAGASRVVLARECTLGAAGGMASSSGLDVEVFVHGAMCVAVSGRCLLSAHLCGSSGSRGACKHSCRWEWQLVEQKRPGEAWPVFETERETIFLGSTDLCMIEHIPDLVKSGVRALKVEGRMKSAAYVATVARVYRTALDRYKAAPDAYAFDPSWLEELKTVSHRPFDTGFLFGYPEAHPERLQTHNRPVSTCLLIGWVIREHEGRHWVEVKNPFAPGDLLEWVCPDGRKGSLTLGIIRNESNEILSRAQCGTRVIAEFANHLQLPERSFLRKRNPDS